MISMLEALGYVVKFYQADPFFAVALLAYLVIAVVLVVVAGVSAFREYWEERVFDRRMAEQIRLNRVMQANQESVIWPAPKGPKGFHQRVQSSGPSEGEKRS